MINQKEIQNAIEWIEGLRDGWNDKDNIKYCNMAIKALEHEQRWIPVSERLPEEYGEYMITWTTSNSIARKHGFLGTAEYELAGEYDAENNGFKGEWLLEDYVKHYKDVKVIAWMPLPEPYKAESEDEL